MYCLNNDLGFLCLFCSHPLYGFSICDNCNSKYCLEFDLSDSSTKISSVSKLYWHKGKIYYIDYNVKVKCIEVYLTKLRNMISVNHYDLHDIIDYNSRVSIYLDMCIDSHSDRKIINKYLKLKNII